MPTNRMIEKQRPCPRPQFRDIRPAVMVNPVYGISWGEPGWPDGHEYDPAYAYYGSDWIEDGYGGGYG